MTHNPHKYDCICAACEDARIEKAHDAARLDAIEAYVNEHGGLVIHTGEADCGSRHAGLGLRPGSLRRTLRQALDSLRGAPRSKS